MIPLSITWNKVVCTSKWTYSYEKTRMQESKWEVRERIPGNSEGVFRETRIGVLAETESGILSPYFFPCPGLVPRLGTSVTWGTNSITVWGKHNECGTWVWPMGQQHQHHLGTWCKCRIFWGSIQPCWINVSLNKFSGWFTLNQKIKMWEVLAERFDLWAGIQIDLNANPRSTLGNLIFWPCFLISVL